MMTFNEIFKKYNKKIVRFYAHKGIDSLIAEELASDVMIRIHKHLPTFNGELAGLNTWIFHIQKNIMIDYFRKKAVSNLGTISLDNLYSDNDSSQDEGRLDHCFGLKDSEMNPEELMIEDEVKELMFRKFNALDEGIKQVASMHYFDGLSYDEVATELNMPLGTVKAKIHKARLVMMDAVPVQLRKLSTFA